MKNIGYIFLILLLLYSIVGGMGYLFHKVSSRTSPGSVRRKRNQVKADLRSIATAIETYYADHGAYPPMIEKDAFPVSYLTTPFAYLSDKSYLDPFAQDENETCTYLLLDNKSFWIVISCGPDGDKDLILQKITQNENLKQRDDLRRFLSEFAYDPTNGLTSNGDVFRTRM